MASKKPLVLVADDEPSMNELVARTLRAMTNPEVQVMQAADGAEAYRSAQKNKPDLVVLDVMMPEMSGWEVCKKIRENDSLKNTAVLMLTGIGETLNSMTSPLYGANAFINKPFQVTELESKVRQILRAVLGKGVQNGAAKPVAAKPVAANKSSAKRAAPKKAVAKKSAAKKPLAKKAAPPKKRAAIKKPARKVAKKSVGKKSAAKKSAKKR